jgi:SAM-dependent methyltransferase
LAPDTSSPSRWLLPVFILCATVISEHHASAQPADQGATQAVLREAIREIQNVCFATYPQKLIESMSGRPGPVPEEIHDDPGLRQKFLKSEEIVTKGLFYPSLLEDLLPAFTAVVRPGKTFLDLGSGDGRVVFLAAHLQAHATGIEYDRTLHRIARRARRQLTHLFEPERATLRRGDFFEADLARYDLLYYFGKGSYGEGRLIDKIRREIREDAILLLSYPQSPPPGFIPIAHYGAVTTYRVERSRS